MTPAISYRLSPITQECFEDTFHADFAQVRIHFDDRPAGYRAVAFASGNRVVLSSALAADGSLTLLPILAHEFTHVVQQRNRRFAPGVVRNRELEAEAQSWERRFRGIRTDLPLFETAYDSGFSSPVIQCASSAYGTLAAPGAPLAGGLQYFTNEKLRKSFREAIENYVRLVKPGEVGVTGYESPGDARKAYVKALYARIKNTPYLLKELVGDKKVAFDDLPAADQRWVRDELYRAWDALRKAKGSSPMPITTRICLGHSASWMDFRTKDCVFAAILHTLVTIDANRKDPRDVKGGQDAETVITTAERDEAAMEAWLASYFGVARAITPDVQIIHLLEFDLGWKNISDVKVFSDLKAGSNKGKSYIVSYERTPGTEAKDAFWHTVYVDISSSGNAKVTDRQATGQGSSGSIAGSAKCDAWLIDKTTTGFKDLKRAFDSRT